MNWLKRLLFAVVCLVTLCGLFITVENWRGKRAWDLYQRQREAVGDSFDWQSVTPAPVPDAENFAAIPLFAELFPKPPKKPRLDALRLPDCHDAGGDWHLGRAENLAAWRRCFTNDDLLAALKVYEPILSQITEALQQRPKCRFPVRYEEHVNALLPHLMHLRNAARIYRLRALAELAAGQTDAALEDVRLGLRLADTIKDEPILISFLVRATLLELAAQPVWEGLAAHRWDDRQLAALQTEFANADQLAAFARAVRGERLCAYNVCRWLIHQTEARPLLFGQLANAGAQPVLTKWIGCAIPTGWWYQNMVTLDRLYTEVYFPTMDLKNRRLDPHAWQAVEETFQRKPRSPYNILSKLLLPALSACALNAASSQTTADEIVIACALQRHRLAKGTLPDTLDALVPEFLAKVPSDIMDGQPLRYQHDGDRFKLWAVGWNRTDDGGTVETSGDKNPRWEKKKGDWVWVCPSSH